MLAVDGVLKPGKRPRREPGDPGRDALIRSTQPLGSTPNPAGQPSDPDGQRASSDDGSAAVPRQGHRRQGRLPQAGRRQVTPLRSSLWVGVLRATVSALFVAPAALAGPTARAVDYLVARQDPLSGGFASGDPADARVAPAYTDWAALAIAAAGEDPRDIGSGATLRGAVTDGAIAATSTASLSRSVQAVVAIGANPRSLRGRNLVAELRARQATDGTFDGESLETAWAVLALRASATQQ